MITSKAEPVARDHQNAVGADGIVAADLAARKQGQAVEWKRCGRWSWVWQKDEKDEEKCGNDRLCAQRKAHRERWPGIRACRATQRLALQAIEGYLVGSTSIAPGPSSAPSNIGIRTAAHSRAFGQCAAEAG